MRVTYRQVENTSILIQPIKHFSITFGQLNIPIHFQMCKNGRLPNAHFTYDKVKKKKVLLEYRNSGFKKKCKQETFHHYIWSDGNFTFSNL